jgi:pyruvate formate lyase activating enzyme
MFYDTSNGGVTVSGGEPLLHAPFVRELFELCRREQINTCVETCGHVDSGAFLEVMPVTDLFLFDLKHLDSDKHNLYTGHHNDIILKNAAIMIEHGADVVFRQPLIPGVNDSLINIEATAEFLKNLGEKALRIELMPFHRMGQDKYKALNMEYCMEDLEIMDNEDLEAVRKAYIDQGINCTISR